MPAVPPLACTRCGAPLPQGPAGTAVMTECPVCRAEHEVMVFPALQKARGGGPEAQPVLTAGEAACFYHAEKRAVVPCDACGRFLCALCDVQLGEKHFCPACLEAGRDARQLGPVERGRVRYDQIVWAMLVLPLPFCMVVAPVTATGAMGLALWKWRAPGSLVVNTRARLTVAMLLAVVELGATTWFWGQAFFRSR